MGDERNATNLLLLSAIVILLSFAAPTSYQQPITNTATSPFPLEWQGKEYPIVFESSSLNVSNISICSSINEWCFSSAGIAFFLNEPSQQDMILNVTLPMRLVNDLFGYARYSGGGYNTTIFLPTYNVLTAEFSHPYEGSFLVYLNATDVSCDSVSYTIKVPRNQTIMELNLNGAAWIPEAVPYPPESDYYGFPVFVAVTVGEQQFKIPIFTNADSCDSTFSVAEKKLHFDITTIRDPGQGYLSVYMPPPILGGNYSVLVDGEPASFSERVYNTNYYAPDGRPTIAEVNLIELNYDKNTRSIDIIGTEVIPEFPIVGLALAGSVFAILITRFLK